MEQKTIIPSQTYSASFNSGEFGFSDNQVAKGCLLFLNISAVTGVLPTLVVQLQAKDPISGNWVNMPSAVSASLGSTGLNIMALYPGLPALSNIFFASVMPNAMRAQVTIGGTGSPSFTFSLGGQALA